MKRVGKLIGLAVVVVVMVSTTTGCMSMVSKLAQSMIKDYGVYDTSVPEDQLSDFLFASVNIKTFNGNRVNWGSKANNLGRIKVPAGTHNFVYDWLQEETRETGSNYNSTTGTTTTTYTTTTRSLKDLEISQIEFLPRHRYSLAGAWIGGQVRIYMQDITNTRAEMYGDIIAKAPKESQTPTVVEGNWRGADTTTFKFAGNTWEMTIPPGIQTNYTDKTSQAKGTFEIDGNKITMYMTHAGMDGKWYNVTGLKTASIWTYSFEGENLNLEVEYLVPNIVYKKQ